MGILLQFRFFYPLILNERVNERDVMETFKILKNLAVFKNDVLKPIAAIPNGISNFVYPTELSC